MKNKRSKKRSEEKPRLPGDKRRLRSLLSGLASFIAGTIVGLFVIQFVVSILPGNAVFASLHGLRGNNGKTIGCTYYVFNIISDEQTEYVYAKFQFPGRIDNFKVGFPLEVETKDSRRTNMQAWEAGRDEKGECAIVQAAVSNDADVQTSAVGNMIAVHSSKLPPKSMIMGLVATTNPDPSVSPLPLYTEGAYEYVKLGQTVRKVLLVSDKSTTDIK